MSNNRGYCRLENRHRNDPMRHRYPLEAESALIAGAEQCTEMTAVPETGTHDKAADTPDVWIDSISRVKLSFSLDSVHPH